MYEFWTQNKLLLMIGLSQFGFVLMMFIIINISQRKLGKSPMSNDNSPNSNPNLSSAAIAANRLNAVLSPKDSPEADQTSISSNNELNTPIFSDPQESNQDMPIDTSDLLEARSGSDIYKIAISPELFTELLEISNNPAETVDEAIRWWLHRRNLNALETSMDRRDRLSSRSYSSKRSQQELWND